MDTLRLEVVPASKDAGGGFEVRIHVNGIEMTRKGAGMGMDPYDVLVPVNRFVARDEPHVTPVARCDCGVYGCGVTDARIARDGDRVRWDWQDEVPMSRPVLFDADAYDREVERAGNDRAWETPDRTAGRLVLSSIAPDDLPGGLQFDWVANDWRDAHRFLVCLRLSSTHQVFVGFDWNGHSPESLASEVRRVLTTEPPARWRAAWQAIDRSDVPPPMAGPRWVRKQF